MNFETSRDRKLAGKLLVVPVALVLGSCSFEAPPSSSANPASMTDRTSRQILTSGALFRLGSLDAQAAVEERPGWVRSAHDYWLDTTEVTQGEFESLSSRNPAPLEARSPAKPVVNVTWFDAALFCNARSKRDHFDTVYE